MKAQALIKYISSQPLALMPKYLDVITMALQEWPEGKLLAVEPSKEASQEASIVDGIKILSYSGTIMKKMSGLQALSGGISTLQVRKDIEAVLLDDEIKGIVLSLDSPGGSVDGTKELADFIAEAKQTKPIVVYADGLMASAAYWIGASADAIVAYDTTQVGSIGVIMTHFDYSKQAKKDGVKPTVLRSGKYKALGSRYEPLSDVAKELIQDDLDYYYSLFVDHVAASRNVDTKVVVDTMAEGRVFIGAKAKEAGLVDHIGGVEKAIQITLELGGNNVKKEVQEALLNGDLPEVLTALATRDDLPADVKTTINTVLTPVEKVEVEKSKYDSMVTDFAEAQTKLAETEAHLEKAEGTIESLKAETAQTEKENAVKALFADSTYEVSDELMTTLLGMDSEQAKVVADNLMATKSAADDVAKALLKDPDGGSSESDSTEPQTLDEAVNVIMAEDSELSIDAAIAKASVDYPELFKRK